MEKKSLVLQTKAFDGETREFTAYAAVFNNVDSEGDKILKGAFTKTIKDRKHMPAVFSNHSIYALPVGVVVEMVEDDKGLLIKGVLCDTTAGNDVYKLMKIGALHSFSIGYQAIKSTDIEGIRVISEIKLYEVSIVNLIPANDQAVIQELKKASDQVDVEALADQVTTLMTRVDDLEKMLNDQQDEQDKEQDQPSSEDTGTTDQPSSDDTDQVKAFFESLAQKTAETKKQIEQQALKSLSERYNKR